MPPLIKRALFLVVAFSLLFGFSFAEAAGAPTIISYQGRLADSSGNLLGGSGTTYYFKFSIWNAESSGSQLWPAASPSSVGLTVRQGVFTAQIGDTAAGFPDALDYDFNTASDIYLEVAVSSDNSSFQTLTPRQRISAAPFARLSSAVSGSTEPSSFGTTTPISNSVVTVEATSTNSTLLSLRAIASQVADLFKIQTSTGSSLFSVAANGLLSFISASSTQQSVLDTLSIGRTATTTIRGETSATSTFAGGISGLAFQATNLVNCDTIDTDSNGVLHCGTDAGAGSGSPGGSDTYVQFNDGGSTFGGDAGLTYNKTDDRLTVVNASTTNITTTYASSTRAFFGSLSVGSLSGFLKATAGSVSTSLISLTADVTGILPVGTGGTGSTTLSGLLKGNGTSALQSAIAGSDYVANTTGDWTGTFDNQEGSYYLNAVNLTNFGTPFYNFFSATTTSALTEGNNLYFTTNRVASVIAGTTTAALAESGNLYFTNARADARINATSTISTLTSAPNLATVATSLTGFLKATAGVLSNSLISLTADVSGILGIANGGTNATSFVTNALTYFDGTRLASTSTSPLYVGSINATTTATSTFAGGVTALRAQVGSIESTSTTATSTFAAGISATRLNTTSTSTLADIVSQSILPASDALYDLGSATNRFRDLFLSTASLHLESTAAETGSAKQWKFGIDTGNGQTTGTSTGFFRIQEGTSPMFYINHAGQVGVGVTDPAARLHIQGNPFLTGFSGGTISSSGSTVTGSGTSFLYGYDRLNVGDQILANAQIRTITAITSNTSLTVDSAFSPALSSQTYQSQQPIARFDSSAGTTKVVIGPGGNVGIGDVNPAGLLSVGANDAFQVNSFGSVASGTWNGAKIATLFGGTGSTTLSGILIGNGTNPVNTLTIGSGLSLTGTTLSASGGGLTSYDAFTHGSEYGQAYSATSTALKLTGSVYSLIASSTALLDKLQVSTTTATSTIAGGLNITGGGFTLGTISGFLKATAGAIANSLVSLTADVTGILPVGNGGTGQNSFTAGNLLYGSAGNGVSTVATGTIAAGTGISITGGPGYVVGSGITINATGGGTGTLSTSSNAVIGNLAYFTGVSTVGNVATTSVTCSGTASCTSFTVLGGAPITITGTGLATYDAFTHPYANTSATSSVLSLTGGAVSASTTITSSLTLSSLSSGILLNNNGLVFSVASSSLQLPNTALANSAVTVNGTSIALGTSGTVTAASSSLLADTNHFSGTGTTTFVGGLQALNLQTGSLNATGTATSTIAGGLNITGGGFTLGTISGFLKATAGAIANSLISLTADVTGILPVGNGGTGQNSFTAGNLLYGSAGNGVSTVATGTISAGTGISITGGPGYVVGSGITINATGGGTGTLSTSSNAVIGNLAYFTGVSTVGNVATTTVTCSGTASCTSFTVLGGAPITITGSGLSSYDSFTHPYVNTSATSSVLSLTGGAVSASTTITSSLTLSSLSSGILLNNNGLVFSVASSSLQLPNTALANSAVTVNGTSIALGTSGTVTAASSSLLADTNHFSGTGTTTFVGGLQALNLQTGSLNATGTATSTIAGGLTITGGGFTLGTISGFLKATAGAIANSLISLTADVSGILPVGNGGTNATSFVSNALLYFDGSKIAATSSTVYVGSLVATTTATSTFAGGITTTGFTLGSGTGFLKAISGAVTQALISLTSDITGVLGIANGGTNAPSLANGLLSFDGTRIVALSSAVTFGSFTATTTATSTTLFGGLQALRLQTGTIEATSTTATSTFANGITLTGGCVVVGGNCVGSGGAALSGGINNTLVAWTSGSTVAATSTSPLYIGTLVATSTTATSTFANGIQINGGGLKFTNVNCSTSGQLLQTNSSGDVICGTDDTSAGAGIGTVQEGGTTISSSATTLNFDANQFSVTDSPAGTENVSLDLNNGLSVGTTSTKFNFAVSTSSAFSMAVFNQLSTGGLLTLQQSGIDRFAVANSGGLTISAATSDVVKTTSGTGRSTDFEYSTASLQNASSTNGYVTIADGTITGNGSLTSTTTITSGTIGAGALAILRSDNKVVIIHGGNGTSASVWDGVSGTMTATTSSTGNVGVGAAAFKRPDGKYLLINGGATAGTSALFDPYQLSAAAAGPAVCGGSATATGTNLFATTNGVAVILCGGFTSWGTYNYSTNRYTGQTAAPSAFGDGALPVALDDGRFLIFRGGNNTTVFIYNPGDQTLVDAGLTAPTAVNTGAVAIRRVDGKYLIIPGTSGQSFLYDPQPKPGNLNGTMGSNLGVGPTATLGRDAQAIWRQDGKFLLFIGGSSQTTNVIDVGGANANPSFTDPGSSVQLSAVPAAGLLAFMMPDGRYGILRGGSNGMDIYDTNFITGLISQGTGAKSSSTYESECIASSDLSTESTMNWNTNNEQGTIIAQVRTATSPALCSSATYKTVLNGGNISATTTNDNQVQFKFTFTRPVPLMIAQEQGVWRVNQTQYQRPLSDPLIYDVRIDNSTALHKTQFDFGLGIASSTAATSTANAPQSGPYALNISNDANGALTLSPSAFSGETLSGSNSLFNLGDFSVKQPNLVTPTASSTIVMKRPDGKFVIISGGVSNAQLYDQTTRLFSSLGVTPTGVIGRGALAFKRPDGTYFIVNGGGQTTTNIYDPVANTFTAGPSLTAAAGIGANVVQLPNGRVYILHGNITKTATLYDPLNNATAIATSSPVTVGSGSMFIPRPDGTYWFLSGVATAESTACAAVTATANFDPYQMKWSTLGAPAFPTPAPGAGGYAFQRKDGSWVIVRGLSTATTCVALGTTIIYDPLANVATLAAGPTLTSVAALGAYPLQRSDGSWLTISGGSAAGLAPQTGTSIYYENSGAFTANSRGPVGSTVAGPTMGVGSNSGGVAFQRDDGRYVIITGGATTSAAAAAPNVLEYDAGFVANGGYRSEEFQIPGLDSTSAVVWKSNMYGTPNGGISAEVRTASSQSGLQTASFREVGTGGLINPGSGETWVQLQFNFKRTFPGYSGILNGVWYSGNGTAYPYRSIPTPTLSEYKITKDKNLIDLQADGLSVLRVSSSGDIYTAPSGSINTSGADLAERYMSQESLENGTVVAIDPYNNHGVKKTQYQYQRDVIGVVSTDPGFVTGAYTENSYPIALVGRVPVKVSTENGMIKTGDTLTAASLYGYAMKATVSGRVIGKALESVDPTKLEECPTDGYVMPRKCSTIMMFVNLIDYNGQPIDEAFADWKFKTAEEQQAKAAEMGLTVNTADAVSSTTASLSLDGVSLYQTHDGEILDFLTQLKAERASGQTSLSEIFTDKVSAISQIISPEMIAQVVTAQEVRGLSIVSEKVTTTDLATDRITGNSNQSLTIGFEDGKITIIGTMPVLAATTTSFWSQVASVFSALMGTSTDEAASSTESVATEDTATSSPGVVITFDQSGNAQFAGEVVSEKVSTGALSVTGVATFAGGLEVAQLGSTTTTMSILSDSIFFGRPYFTSDTGGTAIITKGAKEVNVTFDRDYIEAPIVSASLAFGTTTNDAAIEAVLGEGVPYAVTKRDVHGFTIRLGKKAPADMTFNWIALAIKDSKEFTSRTVEEDVPVSAPQAEPTVPAAENIPPADTGSSSLDIVPPTEPPATDIPPDALSPTSDVSAPPDATPPDAVSSTPETVPSADTSTTPPPDTQTPIP